MKKMIPPEEIQEWIPGELTLDSTPLAWDGLTLRGYRYTDLDVLIPSMRDYMIVVYGGGVAEMSRRSGGPWQCGRVEPGIVSLLTRAEQSQWRWTSPIDVSHLYVSHAAMTEIAGDVFQKDIKDVEMVDVVRSEDTLLPAVQKQLVNELIGGELGGALLVESLRNQMCIHLLRKYAVTKFKEPLSSGILSVVERARVMDFICENRCRNITLMEMAAVLNLSTFHFARKFRAEFGCAPHAYVMRERIKYAQQLIARRDMPLKVVAVLSGFSDQSHMTRLFQRFLNLTPVSYRRQLLEPSATRCRD